MYPNNVPDLVDDQSNPTSLDNRYDDLKKVRPDLVGGKKRVVKPGSDIKAVNTHEDCYFDCGDYQKLASRYIELNRISFLNSSHCDSCFDGKKIKGQCFGRFLVRFDNEKLEASEVM